MKTTTLDFLSRLPLDRVDRIVAGLEGDWSPSAVDIWRRDRGHLDLAAVARRHPQHRPSLELYIGEIWVGIPCFERSGDENNFDEDLARQILELVEGRL